MPAPATPITSNENRATRRWRLAFILYALALTAGTHWPKLRIEAEIPSADKIIHFLAFAGLTWLLWTTRWIQSALLVATIAVAWTCLDEWSQGIPALGRTPSLADALAGLAGVAASMLLITIRRMRQSRNPG